jgi:hypothetical protein
MGYYQIHPLYYKINFLKHCVILYNGIDYSVRLSSFLLNKKCLRGHMC